MFPPGGQTHWSAPTATPEACHIYTVHVKLYGHLPDLAGQDQFAIEVAGQTVRDLLEAMRKICPASLMAALADFQSEPPELLVVAAVDNMPTFYSEGVDSPLRKGSEVVFMPALAGGEGSRGSRKK